MQTNLFLLIHSLLTDLVGPPPTGKIGHKFVPSGKLYSNFIPTEIDLNKQTLTAKYRAIFSIPTEFFDLKTMEFQFPTIRNMGISIPIELQSFISYPTG